jgi:hypothetical protein
MDWATLVITGLATLAAVASALVAAVQARAAKRSDRDAAAARDEARVARDESARLAAKATTAFERQAEAQEHANALKERELAPPNWTGPRHVSGDLYAITNSSGRTVHVSRVEVTPDEAEQFFRLYGREDGVYEFGDSIEYMPGRTMGVRPQKMTMFWHFADEAEDDLRQFIIPL